MSDKNSFVVYTEIEEILDELTDEQAGQLFKGMVSYVSKQEEPKFSGILKFIFIPIRQGLDRDLTKWEQTKEKRAAAGRLGGIKSGEVRKANEANEAVYVNVNGYGNGNGYGDVNVSTGVDVWALSLSVLSFLNQKAGADFRTDDAGSVRMISDLVHQGYTEDDMREVIDRKCDEWLGDAKMERYLRPSTLFKPDNFVKYLDAPDSARRQKAEQEEKDSAYYDEQIRRIEEQGEREMAALRARFG